MSRRLRIRLGVSFTILILSGCGGSETEPAVAVKSSAPLSVKPTIGGEEGFVPSGDKGGEEKLKTTFLHAREYRVWTTSQR